MNKFGKLFGDPKTRKPMKPGTGIAIGVAIGVSLGVAMNNIPIGLAIGLSIGVVFESASKQKPNPQ